MAPRLVSVSLMVASLASIEAVEFGWLTRYSFLLRMTAAVAAMTTMRKRPKLRAREKGRERP